MGNGNRTDISRPAVPNNRENLENLFSIELKS
jgi:hypothetical protein